MYEPQYLIVCLQLVRLYQNTEIYHQITLAIYKLYFTNFKLHWQVHHIMVEEFETEYLKEQKKENKEKNDQ